MNSPLMPNTQQATASDAVSDAELAPASPVRVVLIAIMFAMPGGVVGLLRRVQAWQRDRRARGAASSH